MKTLMLVFGTRPEAIKVAPLVASFAAAPWCRLSVVVTGQHREMLDQVLDLFAIVPDHDLALLQPGQTPSEMTRRVLESIDPILALEAPDAVLVQGDTTTTFAAALAAFYRQIPVIHLEAGLRTGHPMSPYPEEMNRRLTTALTALHLAATPESARNLLGEGVDPARVRVTGNTVIDALHHVLADTDGFRTPELSDLDHSKVPVLLVTAHRRESWGDGIRSIGLALADLARLHPEVEVVFPIHRNPVVRDAIGPAVDGLPNVRLLEPLDYPEFCRLMRRATVVLTDSGGVQEEAPSLGKPVLVMRESTERPEAVTSGTAKLVGTDRTRIVDEVHRLLTDPAAYAAMANAVSPYGDGRATERVVAAVADLFNVGQALPDFAP